ncbi:MAG: carboxypeptidase-like regulatory domain-containing protein [Candidatus Bathyarchaeia archaeon]
MCYVLMAAGMIALALLGARLAIAQSQLNPSYGGGLIRGQVLGFDMYDQLQPIEWATVTATNGQYKFVAYTGSSGYYEMYVPTGTYNVTVIEPGYTAYSNTVAVSDGSSTPSNFTLEQSHVPVPEFPTGMASTIAIVAITAALTVMKHRKRKR